MATLSDSKSRKIKKSKATTPNNIINVDANDIRFTHARVRPRFSGCGRLISDTINDIISGKISIDDIPLIAVTISPDGHIFSLNNRRLYVIKHLLSLGRLQDRSPINSVRARLKPMTSKELGKYTIERCSLTATIIRERVESIENLTSTANINEDITFTVSNEES
mmetsp:Transcript_24936/g.25155  ORF Transcript_24936/g.25155 Transcript_24936/m.25155 type:complete len:165 (-) Transcript_24936:82-576(-)